MQVEIVVKACRYINKRWLSSYVVSFGTQVYEIGQVTRPEEGTLLFAYHDLERYDQHMGLSVGYSIGLLRCEAMVVRRHVHAWLPAIGGPVFDSYNELKINYEQMVSHLLDSDDMDFNICMCEWIKPFEVIRYPVAEPEKWQP